MTFIIILPANIHALSDLLIFPSLSDKLPWQVLIHSSLFGHDLVSINDVCTIPISNIPLSCKESNKIYFYHFYGIIFITQFFGGFVTQKRVCLSRKFHFFSCIMYARKKKTLFLVIISKRKIVIYLFIYSLLHCGMGYLQTKNTSIRKKILL